MHTYGVIIRYNLHWESITLMADYSADIQYTTAWHTFLRLLMKSRPRCGTRPTGPWWPSK